MEQVEKISFHSFRSLLGVYKFFRFVSLMLLFLVHHGLLSILITQEEKRHRYFLMSIRRYSVRALKILNIRITGEKKREKLQGKLLVSNHLSYIDILVLGAIHPSLFVTSVDMREIFFLGHVTRLAGCFFVERRKSHIRPGTKEKELSLMKKKISQGFNVFLFPEGTSSDGSTVLPFKAAFFQLAVDAQTEVIPLCIKYSGKSRKAVPWFGSMTFPDHLLHLCSFEEISVDVTELEPVKGADKFELARNARAEILKAYE